MMRRANSNRNRAVTLRFTIEEYSQINNKFKASTCRGLSDYIRNHLFHRPIVTTYRNVSLDDLMEETIILTNELNAIGKKMSQIAEKINSANSSFEFTQQLTILEADKNKLFSKIKQIKKHTQKIAQQWLQL